MFHGLRVRLCSYIGKERRCACGHSPWFSAPLINSRSALTGARLQLRSAFEGDALRLVHLQKVRNDSKQSAEFCMGHPANAIATYGLPVET
jgi:hypothetical protein